jgi:hypothetical protein
VRSCEIYQERPLSLEGCSMAEYFEEYTFLRGELQDLRNRCVKKLDERRAVRLIVADPRNALQSGLMMSLLFFPFRNWEDLFLEKDSLRQYENLSHKLLQAGTNSIAKGST